jgi:hypothetical protein
MPAPGNDNWASATDISSATAPAVGSTVGATAEAYEPRVLAYNSQTQYPNGTNSNPNGTVQNTVWYKFTVPSGYFPAPSSPAGYTNPAPNQGVMCFYTDSPTGGTATTFPSYVQVFAVGGSTYSNPIENLNEVPYLVDYHAGRFNGQDPLAYVQFIASVGTTYYIRVSSRNGSTGTFSLQWSAVNGGQGVWNILGPCSSMPSGDGLCYGAVQVTNVGGASTVNFPSTLPAGVYEVRYVRGALIYYAGNHLGWTVAVGPAATRFQIVWPESSGYFPELNSGYEIAAQAEAAFQCQKLVFQTCGGTVQIHFTDQVYADNIVPANVAAPTFQLINVTNWATLTAATGNCNFTGSGGSWSCQFGINNSSGVSVPVTVTLLNTGGISGASPAQTLTLPTGTSQTGAFTFSAPISTQFCTATLQLSVCGSIVATLSYPLYPVLTLTSSASCEGPGVFNCCNANCGMAYQVGTFSSIPSAAQMGVSGISFTCTASYAITTCSTGCPTSTSNTASHGFTTGSSTGMNALHNLPIGVPTTVNYSIAITIGSLTYPTYTASYTMTQTH